MNQPELTQQELLESSFIQQNIQEAEKTLEMIESQVEELIAFDKSLSEIIKSDETEILSSLGKGVYIKSNIKEKKLFVEVGSGVIVRKSPEETKSVIESQLKRLTEIRISIKENLEMNYQNLIKLINKIEEKKKD